MNSTVIHCPQCCKCYLCNKLVNRCKIQLCLICLPDRHHNEINESHTNKHFICECGKNFCPDEKQLNCDNCYMKAYHLSPKVIQPFCLLCPKKTIYVCHKCDKTKNISIKNTSTSTCCCGVLVCNKHNDKQCEYCGHLVHNITPSTIDFDCDDIHRRNYNLCCNCIKYNTQKKPCGSWTCEWNTCNKRTCIMHRLKKLRPKRCKEHQLSVSQKIRYGGTHNPTK